MAKATVLQNLGEGKYRIQIKKDLRGVSEKTQALNAEIESLDESIADKKTALELAEEDLKTAIEQADQIGFDYDFESEDPQYRERYLDAQANVAAYGKAVGNLKEEIRQLYARRLNAVQRLEMLEEIKPEKTVYCIAADLNDSIAVGSEVSAIEHARDGNTTAYSIRQGFDQSKDSVVVPSRKMSGWSHLYAQLVQPAAIAQRPKYWFGVIRSIGENGLLADVDIYDRVIRSVSLSPKNASRHTCNCDLNGSNDFLAKFSIGDRVVVDFHFGAGTPTVIGFAVDPGLDFEEEPFKPEPLPQPSGYEIIDTFELRLRSSYYQNPASGLVYPAWTTDQSDYFDQEKWRILGSDDVFDPNFHRCRPYTKHRLVTSAHESCTPSYFYSQAGIGIDELDFYVRSLGRTFDMVQMAGHTNFYITQRQDFYRPTDLTYIGNLDKGLNTYLGDAHIFYGGYSDIILWHSLSSIKISSGSETSRYKQSRTPIASKRQTFSFLDDKPYTTHLSGKIFGAENGSVRMRNLTTGSFEDVSLYADCEIEFDSVDILRDSEKIWHDQERVLTGKIWKPIYQQ